MLIRDGEGCYKIVLVYYNWCSIIDYILTIDYSIIDYILIID